MADRRDAPMVTAERLTLRYGRRRVLDEVSLIVRGGEFWFLLGPNGEGKTTLLRALLGELAPAGGRLVLDEGLRDRAAVGFVPQRCAPNPILPTTVREFVELGLVGVRADPAQRRERVRWALAHAGLAGLERRSYWALSGGQRQRALVARALVRRPRLLILDEPTNHLDFLIEQSILDVLADLNREEGTTILFVTHALHLAARYGTHVALFHGGQVEAGPAAELLRPERLTRAYGVSPPAARTNP
ncbi:MAG TPA: ABC transporter ATP-binding protein [Candidatus Dormibacteraeota bacterium]|nr:ABC transporter ATP-binding protein [Candidatus Dormibacteraeota bacterium]